MLVVVTYESRTGNTQKAAQLVAGGLRSAGADVEVAPIDSVGYGDLARADVVIVGTWCGGLFLFGQHPGSGGKIAGLLPDLWDKATYAFVTYAHNAGGAAEKLGDILEAKGSVNLGSGSLHRDRLEEDVAAFVDEIIDEFAAT
jgi:flavodoxin